MNVFYVQYKRISLECLAHNLLAKRYAIINACLHNFYARNLEIAKITLLKHLTLRIKPRHLSRITDIKKFNEGKSEC